mmetsp:Transcript_7016/g.11570  ORF Transcript_7016/g.11570 Transcript_7016/m.11570 type:complete len:224 (+) Transcript_7016:938-1609(+)
MSNLLHQEPLRKHMHQPRRWPMAWPCNLDSCRLWRATGNRWRVSLAVIIIMVLTAVGIEITKHWLRPMAVLRTCYSIVMMKAATMPMIRRCLFSMVIFGVSGFRTLFWTSSCFSWLEFLLDTFSTRRTKEVQDRRKQQLPSNNMPSLAWTSSRRACAMSHRIDRRVYATHASINILHWRESAGNVSSKKTNRRARCSSWKYRRMRRSSTWFEVAERWRRRLRC